MSLLFLVVSLVAVAGTLWLVVSFPLWWSDAPRLGLPVPLAVAEDHEPIPLTTDLGIIETTEWRGDLEVQFDDAWTQWVYTLVLLVQIFLAAMILDRLRRVVSAFARAEGLGRIPARDLRWAGGLMVLESVLTPAISALVSSLVLGHIASGEVPLGVDWSSGFSQHGFLAGWVLVILSAALQQGAELRDEQSLTV
jgi:hypothetical protein